jgi:hypothetical protein
MRWLLRIWRAWRQTPRGDDTSTARATPAPPAPQARHKPADVPNEYRAFYDYLEGRYATTVVLTFRDIEALLGFSLPVAARSDRAWWTGAVVGADRHAEAWAAARRTAEPNLMAQTVAFERAS